MKSLASLIFLFSSAALALTQTEQTLTPRGQQFELRGGANYQYIDISYDDTSTVAANGFNIPVTAFYGLTDNNAIGFGFSYKSLTADVKPFGLPSYKQKTKGFESFDIRYKGNFDLMKSMTLYVDGAFSIPPEKRNANTLTYEYTASDGQMALTGTVGLVAPVSVVKLGGLFSYRFNMEGDGTYTSNLYNNISTKVSGGNVMTIQFFGEIENAYNPNASIYYKTEEATKTKANGTTISEGSKSDLLGVRGSLRFIATENLDIIPYGAFETIMNKGDFNVDKANAFFIGADARFLF